MMKSKNNAKQGQKQKAPLKKTISLENHLMTTRSIALIVCLYVKRKFIVLYFLEKKKLNLFQNGNKGLIVYVIVVLVRKL